MSDQYTYARFWLCALQVNPVGYNSVYRGSEHGMSEADYNQALLAKCQELDIKVVGLADHGSVDSVDTLRNVLSPLTFFEHFRFLTSYSRIWCTGSFSMMS
jgi:hypothetical protein